MDAAKRNTLPNKLYHHLVNLAAAGAGDKLGGMAEFLGDPFGSLERTGSSAYAGVKRLYNDPEGVGEAAYQAYDEFNKLTPTQQNDAYVRFASRSHRSGDREISRSRHGGRARVTVERWGTEV